MLQKDTWAGERGNVYQGVDAKYTKAVLSQTIADIFHDHYDRRWCTFFCKRIVWWCTKKVTNIR